MSFKRTILFAIMALLLVAFNTGTVQAQAQSGRIKVAVFLDRGAHFHDMFRHELFEQEDMAVTILDSGDIRSGALRGYDVLLVPGGLSKIESRSLKDEGRDEIRRFVHDGGCYLGICAGCYLATSGPHYLDLLPAHVLDKAHWHRGKAELAIELTPFGEEVFHASEPMKRIVYHNGPILKIRDDAADRVKILSYYRQEVVAPGGERGIMKDSPAMICTKYGEGIVMGFSPHAEATPALQNYVPDAIRWMFRHRQ